MDEKLLTVPELAKVLRVKKSWVYSRTRDGSIPMIKVGRYPRFKIGDVMQHLREKEKQMFPPRTPFKVTCQYSILFQEVTGPCPLGRPRLRTPCAPPAFKILLCLEFWNFALITMVLRKL